MERREAIRYTALFMGVALSGSTVASLLAGCEVDDSPDWKPSFFTEDEARFIRELGETLLPRTKTPGAKDALVDRYLDGVRPLRFTAEQNADYKAQLGEFMKEARKEMGRAIHKADPARRQEWLAATDAAAYQRIQDNPDLPPEERPFYLTLKEHILSAYFNSEKVAKEYFAFDPIPGRYDPCIPFSEVGRAWAL